MKKSNHLNSKVKLPNCLLLYLILDYIASFI